MPRSKVKLEFIADEYARKTSFMKRKTSVMKKLNELCTLCGVEACAIMYSGYEPQLEVWPSAIGVQFVLDQFMTMPEVEQSKKMVNQDSYLRKRICKAKEQLDKYTKDNKDKRTGLLMSQCLSGELSVTDLNLAELQDLVQWVDSQVSEINSRIEFLKGGGIPPPPPPPPPPQPHLPQPQADAGARKKDKQVVEEGGGVVAADEYVPVEENPDETLEGVIPSTEWFVDWVDGMSFVDQGVNPFASDPNPSAGGGGASSSSKPN